MKSKISKLFIVIGLAIPLLSACTKASKDTKASDSKDVTISDNTSDEAYLSLNKSA
mgnify:CR=1 FL=1